MLSKIQESDFEDDFHDSFEHIQSKIPKKEKAQGTVDIDKVLSLLTSTIENLKQDQSFSNQLNWIYATILNYYLYLVRKGSLKYHPISKIISKIQKLLPLMQSLDSVQDEQSESVIGEQDAQLDQESEADSDYYNALLKRNKQKKIDRENTISQEKKDKREANYALQDSDLINDDEKRMASWKILTNKGLTPHRKKENRNPRVKKRKKYEKAVKKLSSFRAVAVDKAATGPYGGERTGIRRNLTRSIKF
jgi:ribosomal protein S30